MFDDETKPRSVPSLIAWLGLCLLSASLGRLMPATVQTVWGYVGLFGLAAGLGLGAMEQSRRAQNEREQRQAWQVQQQQMLSKFVPHIKAASEERAAEKLEDRP